MTDVAAPGHPIDAAAGVPRADVLIVDDNPVNRQLLTAILRREAVDLRAAVDGRDALEQAQAQPPDLVLLDIMMPNLDGYEVCAALKRDPRTAHVPVIFLSALAEAANKIRGLELGAVDYITKPFDRGEVVARVRTQLNLQRLAESLREAHIDLQAKQARIEHDLRAASVIQRSLLPAAAPLAIPGVELAWRLVPSASIGGDMLGCQPLGDDHLALFVFDVSGHGVPAAMVTVSVSQFLAPQCGRLMIRACQRPVPTPPAAVLALLEREYPFGRFERFLTMAYVVVELRTGRLRYAVAGHPPPIILRRDGALERLEVGGPLIGLGDELPFEEGEAQLGAGDRLLLYTDGLADAAVAGGAPDEGALERDIIAGRALSLEQACDALLAGRLAVDRPAPGIERDDMTLLALEYTGAVDGGAR